jgi:hypothetical protein
MQERNAARQTKPLRALLKAIVAREIKIEGKITKPAQIKNKQEKENEDE